MNMRKLLGVISCALFVAVALTISATAVKAQQAAPNFGSSKTAIFRELRSGRWRTASRLRMHPARPGQILSLGRQCRAISFP